jgi:beta-N-acetylhexosaminidase
MSGNAFSRHWHAKERPVRLTAVILLLLAIPPPAVAGEMPAVLDYPPAQAKPAAITDAPAGQEPARGPEDPGGREPSLRQMIGQMLLIGFPGTKPDEDWPQLVRGMIHDGRIGGVVLFPANIVAPSQVRALNAALESANARLRPFICVDQEGGAIQRLPKTRGFVGLPAAAEVARMTPDKARELDSRAADELAGLGFNVNFGPVVDLNINPGNPTIGRRGRSFGADPDVVITYARQFIAAHTEAGVLTVAKHFPGLGSGRTDPHLEMVDISKTWNADELLPYKNLIGGRMIDMIMVGHQIAPEFSDTADTPASLSRRAIDEGLRSRLGFGGLVVTDDLNMVAIQRRYSTEQAAVMAVAAGADLLIVANNGKPDPTVADRVTNAIAQAVADGRISAEQVRRAYNLIVFAKLKLSERNTYVAE